MTLGDVQGKKIEIRKMFLFYFGLSNGTYNWVGKKQGINITIIKCAFT